ncbi:DNA polymerase epsilon subunit 3 [Toxocara canis]|uniref:DNA polymerase epsilon subunit 3 n=1 Tax=Toxocara canis TaxID=6265 RepID=A0A0B2VII6_TOXCA|nr:DNA polymerase epsilon subunit 3 [Toxocara canis]
MSSSYDAAEELRLPQTVISRLVKDALPPGVIVSKEARTAIARAAAVFILHASTYAQDCAVSNRRKTVTAADVLSAMRTLECDDLIEPVKEAVDVWKSNKQQKLDDAKKRKAEREKQASEASTVTSKEGTSESTNALSPAAENIATEAQSNDVVEADHSGGNSAEVDSANAPVRQSEANED